MISNSTPNAPSSSSTAVPSTSTTMAGKHVSSKLMDVSVPLRKRNWAKEEEEERERAREEEEAGGEKVQRGMKFTLLTKRGKSQVGR
jgi:hypothetical protein